jgi:hypothetical protein
MAIIEQVVLFALFLATFHASLWREERKRDRRHGQLVLGNLAAVITEPKRIVTYPTVRTVTRRCGSRGRCRASSKMAQKIKSLPVINAGFRSRVQYVLASSRCREGGGALGAEHDIEPSCATGHEGSGTAMLDASSWFVAGEWGHDFMANPVPLRAEG